MYETANVPIGVAAKASHSSLFVMASKALLLPNTTPDKAITSAMNTTPRIQAQQNEHMAKPLRSSSSLLVQVKHTQTQDSSSMTPSSTNDIILALSSGPHLTGPIATKNSR